MAARVFGVTRRAWLLCVLALAALPAAARADGLLQFTMSLNGTPRYLGTIAASTTKNNHDTAAPFNNTGSGLANKLLLIQCDAAAHILPGTTNATTVTTSNGVKLAADERVVVRMEEGYGWLAAVGAANCKVWELRLN